MTRVALLLTDEKKMVIIHRFINFSPALIPMILRKQK